MRRGRVALRRNLRGTIGRCTVGSRQSPTLDRLLKEAEEAQRCAYGHRGAEATCLAHAKARGVVWSPLPGLYVRPSYWAERNPIEQALHAMRALQQLHPAWTFGGPSAAIALGLAVSYAYAWPLRVTTSRRAHARQRPGILRPVVDGDASVDANGLRTTSLARTAFDCLREMPLTHGLAVADSLLRCHRVEKGLFVERLASFPHNAAGWLHAQEVAALADARAESGGESVARARMILLGYEVPDLQVELPNIVDGGTYFGDFGWRLDERRLIVGELDGGDKYVDPAMTGGKSVEEVLRDERHRESRVTALDVRVMRFTYADAMNDAVFTRILDAFEVPRATKCVYEEKGERYQPAGLDWREVMAGRMGW